MKLIKMLVTGVLGGGGAAAPTYTISGTVYDANGSTAVAGATVALGAKTANSAADGTYTISGVASGASGSMTCTLAGYSWAAITVAAMSGNLTAQNYVNAWYAALGISADVGGVWKPTGAASLAASYSRIAGDLGNASIDPAIVGGVAPTWDASTGWNFDGTATQYLKTGIVPGSAYTMLIKFNGVTEHNQALCGALTAAGSSFFIHPNRDDGVGWRYGNGAPSVMPSLSSGVLVLSGDDGYRGGSLDSENIGTWSGTATQEIYIGGYNNNGTPALKRGNVNAFAVWDRSLTPTEVAAVVTALG